MRLRVDWVRSNIDLHFYEFRSRNWKHREPFCSLGQNMDGKVKKYGQAQFLLKAPSNSLAINLRAVYLLYHTESFLYIVHELT